MKMRVPKLRSVSVWLTFWNIFVLATVLVGFAIAVRYTIQAHISARVNESTSRIAHNIQRDFTYSDMPPFGGPGGSGGGEGPTIRRMERSGRGDANDPLAGFHPAILDLAGKAMTPFSNDREWDPIGFAAAASGAEKARTVTYQSQTVRVYSAPLIRDDRILGVVQVAMPLSDVHHTLTWVNDALKDLIPLALFVAGLGGALLTYRALKPVRKLAQAAERIEAGNLSGRLPTGGGDEFSELAHTFNNMLDRLENAFRGLEESHEQQVRFVGDASHELKTPLTAIKAHTSLALSGTRSAEQYRRTIASIDHAADRMGRIIQDLLILARADAGEYEIARTAVPLSTVVDEAIDTVCHPEVAAIEFPRADSRLCVLGDSDSLTRLFANILANAVRHTPESGKITITAKQAEDTVRIEIADTGEGIAAEHLPHLTKRFYRVDSARARTNGGTGLGLAICQTIVDAHSGSLAIASKLGQGTTVTVTLPAAADAVRPGVESGEAPQAEGSEALSRL